MTLIYEDEAGCELGFDLQHTASEVIETALDMLECPYESQISLLVTGPTQIREMNRDYRGIDKETDVLSFPMNDFPAPGVFEWLEDDEAFAEAFDPESGELLLGDIVINEERVRSQAEQYGHSLRREFAFLTAHSVLHLCGFDHMTVSDAAIMESLQEKVLQQLGITRDQG